jgi:hypothetical protein
MVKHMSEHDCFKTVFPSLLPFERVLSLGWYDGTTSGLALCAQYPAVFKYDILDWDSDQEHRIFALSPIDREKFDQLVDLFSSKEEPKWPFWHPRWQISPTEKALLKAQVDQRLAQAKSPEYVIASDRRLETVFAAKRLSGSAMDRLPLAFDGLPVSNSFDYWREYVGLRI